MNGDTFYLSAFENCEPKFRASQNKTLEFLRECHQNSLTLEKDPLPIEKWLARYGVNQNQIGTRSFEAPDLYLAADQRDLYHANRISGADIEARTDFFHARANEIFEKFYPHDASSPPDHLLHVTCTGYISPSAPQVLVAARGWPTEITHAYHMGCYASLPAIRLACGQASLGKNVDIVHTEMCSLHLNPSKHSAEQLVVQSLFADGHIRYQLTREKRPASFKVLAVKERILPDTGSCMTWAPGPYGMVMTLSREVPRKIAGAIRTFVQELLEENSVEMANTLKQGIFAIHPGGPKIIDMVSEALELQAPQTAASRKILFERGNMSSATLPHIWQSILAQPPATGNLVVSLAFGPGLSIFGSVFEYQA